MQRKECGTIAMQTGYASNNGRMSYGKATAVSARLIASTLGSDFKPKLAQWKIVKGRICQ
jgi:hypothetical protein